MYLQTYFDLMFYSFTGSTTNGAWYFQTQKKASWLHSCGPFHRRFKKGHRSVSIITLLSSPNTHTYTKRYQFSLYSEQGHLYPAFPSNGILCAVRTKTSTYLLVVCHKTNYDVCLWLVLQKKFGNSRYSGWWLLLGNTCDNVWWIIQHSSVHGVATTTMKTKWVYLLLL